MSFPRYPKYKETGVEWLGEVPEHWKLNRIGHFFAERREQVSDLDFAALSVTKNGIVPQLDSAAKTDNGDKRKKVCAGDFAINSRSDRKGSAGVSELDGSVSVITTVLSPRESVHGLFIHHLLRSQPFQEEFYRFGKGIVADLWSTRYSEMRNITLAVPSLPEQKAIAEFLDRETGKIDELVEEQRSLIALLKEKRQAVISHAVTKGLNPHAPMKHSGIEWLGEVPEHWEVKHLRNVFKFSKGLTITKENLQDEGVYCVNYGEIHSKYGFRLNPLVHKLRCVSEDYLNTNPDALINDGDFVFADTSEDLEGSGNFTHLRSDNPIFAGYHTIIGRPSRGANPLFLAFHINSNSFRSQIQRQVKGVKVFSISQGILKAAKCFLPPLPEQKAIAEFLDTELAKFDTLTIEAQRAIELLQERRTALISAAVTGQIDVRHYSPNH